jgi:hypothetical protein
MIFNTPSLGLLLSPALLALASCSSPPPAVSGEQDGGSDAGADAGPPVRTATTRALLATPVDNLLLDPFVTSDTSLGHFVGVLLPIVNGNYQSFTAGRSFVSQAPAGVAAPVGVIPALASDSSATPVTSGQIVAPFPGGTAPFNAQVWASASDATGAPVTFAAGGGSLKVSLLPNDLSQPAYVLTVTGSPVELDGRQWVLLALATPVPMTQGGWFSIFIDSASSSFQLQAPQVTPATGASMDSDGGGSPRTTPRTERDSRVLEAYVALTHRPRRRLLR